MRAMVQISYGPPEVIVPQEIAKPSPGDKEILIRIQAAQSRAVGLRFSQGRSIYD